MPGGPERIFFLLVIGLFGCLDEPIKKTQALFEMLPVEETNINFQNTIVENNTFNMVDFFYVYNGGGVAIGDINNDGLSDIYFTGNMVDDRLYLNKGNLSFEDISETSGIQKIPGWSTGVTMVDINADGHLDIYVCRSGNYPSAKRKNLLFINNGDLTFSEQAESWGIADSSYSTHAAFFDFDKDGDQDMYLLNHTNDIKDPNNIKPLVRDGTGLANDHLFQNNGSQSFINVTREAGILYDGFGLGLGISDLNNDGWEDIYISNDFLAQDYLYVNNKDGTFSEIGSQSMKHFSQFGMGTDLADFNNDGLVDIVVADMLPSDNLGRKKMAGPLNFNLFEMARRAGYHPQYMRNTLQLNRGKNPKGTPLFSEIGQLSEIYSTDWSWAPLLADFDNDGKKDLFVSNGYLRDVIDLDFINYTARTAQSTSRNQLNEILKNKARETPGLHTVNKVFKNSGNYQFIDKTKSWGLDQPSYSNGASYADLDNDGDLDLVVSNINQEAFVYKNHSKETSQNQHLKIKLKGNALDPLGIGTEVKVFSNNTLQLRRQNVSRGYQSSIDYSMHFGLGNAQRVDSVVIIWPDSNTSKLTDIAASQTLTIRHSQSKSGSEAESQSTNVYFKEVSPKHDINHIHNDVFYLDFSRQYLLPHKHSQQGPGIAVADINGDGLDDFFVGAGYGANGQLHIQKKNNTFRSISLSKEEGYEEDLGILFFDADTDGDKDLYIASGGNEFFPKSKYYQDRLYMNNGKGQFNIDTTALPITRYSTSCVRGADFDQDGDIDLFVGGRLSPLQYPYPGESQLLINEKGQFKDQIDDLAPGLKTIGMVTDAMWTDIDNDFDTDLIIVGEFMSITVFENKEGKLVNISDKTGLQNTSGWWNSMAGADFDNDGDIDYIIGNLGLNSRFKVSPKTPLTVYAADYDGNGHLDPIMSYHLNGHEYPVHSRDDLIGQMAFMKKKFPDYLSYANSGIDDVISNDAQNKSFVRQASIFETVYMENLGNAKFGIKKLPIEAQFAPVYGILTGDYNQDGFEDIILTGNSYGTEVMTGQYDASIGALMLGDGNGHFKPVSSIESGLYADGDMKGAAIIHVGDNLVYLFARNSAELVAYEDQASKYDLIRIDDNVLKATVIYKNGSSKLREFYHGSSYLSQSSRILKVSRDVKKIHLYDHTGKEKEMIPNTSHK